MQKKEFVVFGLGRFGWSVATTLAESGCEVLVVDESEEKIREISEIVTHAVRARITDAEVLRSLGISNFDGAVIAMAEDLESSVLTTILVKELGVSYILAKAQSEIHAKILRKIGADMIVFPEKETGIRIANNLIMGNFFDAVELSSTFSMIELALPDEWHGKTLQTLDLRNHYQINVIGLKRNGEVNITPNATLPLHKDDMLFIIGKNETLNKLRGLKRATDH